LGGSRPARAGPPMVRRFHPPVSWRIRRRS
jgi:hypothetical protein